MWTFDVDGVTYQHDEPRITGGEIMALAGVHPSQILLQYFEDGFDETIDPDDVVRALATAKRRTGRRLGSPTLVADSAETLLCAYLSVILLVGLVLNATVGWWWADPLAAIGIAFLALREGREATEETTKQSGQAEQG